MELNLLPDIKLEYIKAQRLRRLIYTVATIVTAVSVGLLIVLLVLDYYQKAHINSLNNQINNNTSTLKNEPQINKILTVQNQLKDLSQLHLSKPNVSQLFTYLNELTPNAVFINDFTVDFNAHTMVITGTSDSLKTVNQFIDTLKYTNYTSTNVTNSTPAFSGVVLTTFGPPTGGSPANYTINLNYDPNIFDISQTVNLNVPNIVTTRVGIAQPTDLFQNAPAKPGGGAQ